MFPSSIKKAFVISFLMTLMIGAGSISALGREKMLIAVHEYPPIYDKTGKGLISEVYIAAGKAVDIDVTIKSFPIKRGIQMLLNNKVDAFSPGQVFMNPKQKEMTSIIPTVFYAVVGFAHYDPGKDKNFVLNSLDDFKDYKMATIVGSPLIPLFKKHGLKWEEKQSVDVHLKMLKAKRVDFAEMTALSTLFNTKRLYGDKMSDFAYVKFINIPCTTAFSNSRPGVESLKSRFAKGVEIIKKNGTYMRIAESYWGKKNVMKDALPDDLKSFGIEKADFTKFSKYDRTPWGKIR